MGLIQQENSAGPSRLTAIVDEEASSSFIIMDDCKSGAGDRSQDASSLLNAAAIFDLSSSPSSYSALEDMMIDHIARHAALENFESSSQTAVKTAGRLGPDQVSIDKSSARGQLTYSHGEMCMEASGAFSSARANVCVFGGKWQYECLITCAWTAGIQQIGWAPLSCPFTAEEGVGDAPDSYAYDGKRVKKWNVRSQNYGEAWTTGDVIGACIDLKVKFSPIL